MANNHHNNNNRTSILIVDDHEVVRNGIRSYLETVKDFQVVGEAASGEEAIKLVSEHIPDIVLLREGDAGPDLDGHRDARNGRCGDDAAHQTDQPAHPGSGVDFLS